MLCCYFSNCPIDHYLYWMHWFCPKKYINAIVSCENSFHKWSVFYSGTQSYKEHGFRLLMIWLHGVRKDENVMRLLFEALSTIDRRSLAGIFTIVHSLIQKKGVLFLFYRTGVYWADVNHWRDLTKFSFFRTNKTQDRFEAWQILYEFIVFHCLNSICVQNLVGQQ